MKSLKYTCLTLILLILLTSCSGFNLEEDIPYNFEFQEQVFITGLLTNEFGFVSLDIQKSIPANTTGFNPVNDAKISLYTKGVSNSGTLLVTDSFTVNNGRYTSSQEITPTVGNTYWTEIILEDGTQFKSDEEILKPAIALTITETPNESIRVTIADPIDEENFYLFYVEYFKDDNLISDDRGLIDDINDESELYLNIINHNEGVTVKVSLFNINFNTFQFYNNSLFQGENEVDIFFAPLRNLYGNIINTSTNKIALGNFGIVGFSSVIKDF
ncbi:MAG: hypothetical protein ABJK28_07645 [Algibacter sp.]